jgi:hypothetical protein
VSRLAETRDGHGGWLPVLTEWNFKSHHPPPSL